jgi:putative component of toxin-antitoxin plasmid stabilization module
MRCIIDLRQHNFKSDEIYGAKNGKRMIVKLCGAVIRLREEMKNKPKNNENIKH